MIFRRLPVYRLAFLLVLVSGAQAQAPALSWVALDGPSGGPATGIASRNEGSVAVSATPDGLYRTDDGGGSWTRTDTGPGVPEGVFAGPGGTFWALGSPLLRSADDGATWTDASDGLPQGVARSLAARTDGTLFAATDAGVYRLPSSASVWQPTAYTQPVSALGVTPDGTLLAGLAGTGIGSETYSVARSDDGGATWQVVPVGTYRQAEITGLAVLADGSVLVGGYPTSDTGRAASPHRSVDAGQTWARVEALPDGFVTDRVQAAGPVAVVTGSAPESYVSTDAGATWRTVPFSITGLSPGPDGSVLASTLRRGIVRTDDLAATFTDATDGLGRASVGHIATSEDLVLAARTADFSFGTGLYRSSDRGQSWTRIPLDFDARGLADIHIDPAGRVFASPARCFGAACAGSGVYRSLDRGLTWVVTALTFPGSSTEARLFDGAGDALWALSSTRALYRSVDGGASWAQVASPPYSRTFAAGADGTLWVGSAQPDVSVARSTDGGASWTEVLVRASGGRTSALVVASDGSVVVGAIGRGHRSADGGATWQPVDFGVAPSVEITALRFSADGSLFAGTDGDAPVLRSLDDGQTWAPVADGLPEARIPTDLTVADDGTLWTALGTGGLYRTRASTFVADEPAASDAGFALTVAPNPSYGRASVTIHLAESRDVRVSVYDALGRRIALLHDGPASDTLTLSVPEALPAGVYVVRVSVGDWAASRRLVVVR